MNMLVGEPVLASAAVPMESGLHDEVEVMRRRLLRLAFDVHDGPMQSLTAVGWGLQQLRRDLLQRPNASRAAEVTAQLDLLGAELASVEAGLRSLITSLERGGSAAIDSLEEIAATEIARFTGRCDAAIELVVPRNLQPDSHSQALAISAVLREALNNIARHAHADQVFVRLLADDLEILLEISDNGTGFDPAVSDTGIGLTSMRERLRLLSGTLEISSTPGGPTQIIAHFRRWQPPLL